MTTNQAAWLPTGKVAPLAIAEAAYHHPKEHELVIKNHALAVNLMDYAIQDAGNMIAPWIKYPFIPGSDVAGEVVATGDGVSGFTIGDRVVGFATGVDKLSSGAREGAFQLYTVLQKNCCSVLPDSMSFVDASVLPMGVSTAASGLFASDYCGLDYPSISPKSNGQCFLVWGGSTSVGCNAIQLATAAGYEVITTSSPRNFEYLKTLGARHIFDYRNATTPTDIIELLKNKDCAGAIAIGDDSASCCIDIVATSPSSTERKFVAQATVAGGSGPPPKGAVAFACFVFKYLKANAILGLKARSKGVSVKFIWGTDLRNNEVGSVIYEDYLPAALAQGTHVPAPPAEVVGVGLESVKVALDKLRGGVTLQKLVVTF